MKKRLCIALLTITALGCIVIPLAGIVAQWHFRYRAPTRFLAAPIPLVRDALANSNQVELVASEVSDTGPKTLILNKASVLAYLAALDQDVTSIAGGKNMGFGISASTVLTIRCTKLPGLNIGVFDRYLIFSLDDVSFRVETKGNSLAYLKALLLVGGRPTSYLKTNSGK